MYLRNPITPKFESGTIRMMGLVEIVFALIMLIPFFIAIYYNEDTLPFSILPPILVIAGTIQYLLFAPSKNIRSVNGLLIVIIAWAFVFFIGMVPYWISGLSIVDSLFESVSGFTTTGATIMADIESHPRSLLIWRSLTQWVGGFAVIIIFMYILPILGVGRTLFSNELSGSGSNNYTVKMEKAARSFIVVYGVLSLLHLGLLLLCGVDTFNAVCMMFSTISTGGLMCTNNSLEGFSDVVQIITMVFMFMGGVNFYLHYRALYYKDSDVNIIKMPKSYDNVEDVKLTTWQKIRNVVQPIKRIKVYFGNSEFRFNLAWFIGIAILIYAFLYFNAAFDGMTSSQYMGEFKNIAFTVISLGTTTGYSVNDYTQYPVFVILLLFLVAFFGASAGSTSGGIKLYRLRVVYGFLMNAVYRTLRPNNVFTVKMDRNTVSNDTVMSAVSVVLVYILTLVVAAAIIMGFGFELADSFGLSVSAVSNGGLGFGNFGPYGSMSVLPDSLKLFLAFLMWVGRLEILVALLYFTPSFWKELWINHRTKVRLKWESKNKMDN